MSEKKTVKKSVRKVAKKAAADGKSSSVFTADERAAMREYVEEVKGSRRRAAGDTAADAAAVREKLASMSPSDRAMGERIHMIIASAAPELAPKLWYGMPAYAKDGSVVCFFQGAAKFKTRYSTLGFSDKAMLDDGRMWPTSYALMELTADDEARIAQLVRKAAG